MTPDLARLKKAIARAVHTAGGIDAVKAQLGRGSVVGEWHNERLPTFPNIKYALEIDEVAVIMGQHPHILTAYAAALGHAVVRLPVCGADNVLTHALIEASAEFGEVAHEVREATRDGEVSLRESERIITAIDEAITALVAMRNGLEREAGK